VVSSLVIHLAEGGGAEEGGWAMVAVGWAAWAEGGVGCGRRVHAHRRVV
jgi:hypothetical protein